MENVAKTASSEKFETQRRTDEDQPEIRMGEHFSSEKMKSSLEKLPHSKTGSKEQMKKGTDLIVKDSKSTAPTDEGGSEFFPDLLYSIETTISKTNLTELYAKRHRTEKTSIKDAPSSLTDKAHPHHTSKDSGKESATAGDEEVTNGEEPPEEADPKTIRKGVCFEFAGRTDLTCGKNICRPKAVIRVKKSKTGEDQKILRRICQGGDETVLTCINRPVALKKYVRSLGPIDLGIESETAFESTIVRSSVTDLMAQAQKDDAKSKKTKVDEQGVKETEEWISISTAAELQSSRQYGHRDTAGTVETTGKAATFDFIEGILTGDEDEGNSKSRRKSKEDKASEGDLIPTEVEVCECCKCVTCRCLPKYISKYLTKEQIDAMKLRALQSGWLGDLKGFLESGGLEADLAVPVKKALLYGARHKDEDFIGIESDYDGYGRKKLSMNYSWDTQKVPSDWQFEKDQLAAKEEELKLLVEQAEKLEAERLEAFETSQVEKDEYIEKLEELALDENEKKKRDARRKETEKEEDWAAYKAMEWAGLRQQFTQDAKQLAPATLDEVALASWTSQPPPQLILGTVSPYIRRDSSTSTSLDMELGPVQERSESFLQLNQKGVSIKIGSKAKAMEKQYLDEKMEKKGKEHKQGKASPTGTASVASSHSQRAKFYDNHIVIEPRHKAKPTKLSSYRRKSPIADNSFASGGSVRGATEANEWPDSDLPLGLRREAGKFRTTERDTQASVADERSSVSSSRSLPPAAAARLRQLQLLNTEKEKSYSCPCLPGFCTCEGKAHWTFAGRLADLEGMAVDDPRKIAARMEEPELPKTDSQLRAAGIYVWKGFECPCSHSADELTSPDESEEERAARIPKIKAIEDEDICTCRRRYEQTLVIVKPDAMIFKDVIKRALIHLGGLHIVNERILHLTPEQVSEIYSESHYGSPDFPLLVIQLSQYPILALSVGGMNAVEVVKSMVGSDKMIPEYWFYPESIKRKIGIFSNILEAVHVSENTEQAAIENRYFFPLTLIEPIPTIPNRVSDYCGKYVNPTLTKGLATVAKVRPDDPVMFLAEWLLTHNPYQPHCRPHGISMLPT